MDSSIKELLESVTYGTLGLCGENCVPYAVPVNFVYFDNKIYIHGAKVNRKMELLKENPKVSFSVVQEYSLIQSYFSSTDGLACPATHFFKSLSIAAEASIVEDSSKKAKVLEALMQKLQSEGGYKPLSEAVYKKAVDATGVVELYIETIDIKVKLGQNLPQKRWDMIIEHLNKRATPLDLETVVQMQISRRGEKR